ncbi:MAG TPA: hypothetical protein VK974_09750 [Methylophilaceae bacterium]|nr:hypothetical protein [Methylophilaceae bacterium]
MKKILTFLLISSASIHCCMSFADDSPESPAFVLKPYQGLSVTNLEYSKIKADFSSDFFGVGRAEGSFKYYRTSVSEALRFGLPSDLEIRVAQKYQNYGVRSDDFSGFLNPTFGLRKTFRVTPDININLIGSITPKTADHGIRANPTLYDLGVEGVLKTPSGLITVLGLGREIVNSYSSFNTTLVYAGAYKEVGDYSLSILGSIRASDHSHNYLGSVDSIQTVSAAIGRQVTSNVWAQLIYRYVNQDSDAVVYSNGDVHNLTTKENQMAATLRVLF